jgi:CheY-like chemotaxis protein
LARKILLADDSVTAQNMGRRILSEAGYDVLTVNNGSAALKKIAELKPDLVILDVYMPGYGGLEVCQRIKESPETFHIPVLLTVGKLEPFKADEARRVRADAHLVKPFEASELLTALTKLEDKIVPQAESRARNFAKTQSAEGSTAPVDGSKFGDSMTGWKERLGIPASSPKVEEEEPVIEAPPVSATAFRDFERAPEVTARPAQASSVQDGMVSDVTADEIAAIAAAATAMERATDSTQVTSEAPAVEENYPPIADMWRRSQESSPPIEAHGYGVLQNEVRPPEAQPTEIHQREVQLSEFQPIEPQSEIQHSEFQPTGIERMQVESAAIHQSPGQISAEALEVVQFDAPQASEQAPEMAAVADVGLESTHAIQHDPESLSPAAELASPVQVSSEPAAEAMVADAEVAAAIESLAPANGDAAIPRHETWEHSAETRIEKHEDVFAHAEAPAHAEFAESRYTGPRWIADEASLTENEAASILEREMEKAYAALKETDAYRAGAEEAGAEGSSFIEHRDQPIAAQLEPAVAQAESFAVEAAAPVVSETIISDVPAGAAEAIFSSEPEAVAAIETIAEAKSSEFAPEPALRTLELAVVLPEAQPEVSPALIAEAVASESATLPEIAEPEAAAYSTTEIAESAPVSAMASDSQMASDSAMTAPQQEAAFAAAAGAGAGFGAVGNFQAIPEPVVYSEGVPSPSPERAAELAAAWAHWRQIRETISGPEITSQVAAAAASGFKDIQPQSPPMSPPEAEASTTAVAGTDSASIASIVDSVLSQLRPKLVEEIAKKLSEKNK